MPLPSVSVVIPIKDRLPLVLMSLRSLKKQLLVPIEIVLVFNGCRDPHDMIDQAKSIWCDSSNALLSPLILDNGNVSHARNQGIRFALGKIIILTDSDCTFPEEWIARYMQDIDWSRAEGKVFVGGECLIEGRGWAPALSRLNQRHFHAHRSFDRMLHFDSNNCIALKETWMAFPFDVNVAAAEDFELFCRMLRARVSFIYKDNPVFHHCQHRLSSILKTKFHQAIEVSKIDRQNINAPVGEKFRIREFDFFNLPGELLFFPNLLLIWVKFGWRESVLELLGGVSWRLGIVWQYLQGSKIMKLLIYPRTSQV